MTWYEMTCCALGSTMGASAWPSGMVAVHGDDDSSMKNTAPRSRTVRRTSESGSRG